MSKVKVYLAQKMTGRPAEEVIKLSLLAQAVFGIRNGFECLDPVEAEGVQSTGAPINNTARDIRRFWARDKQMIRDSHVVVDLTPDMKSEGVAHELGFARYYLWKPVLRVYTGSLVGFGIHTIEDDGVCLSIDEAARVIKRFWGTPWKRAIWRTKMYLRCLPQFLVDHIKEWK